MTNMVGVKPGYILWNNPRSHNAPIGRWLGRSSGAALTCSLPSPAPRPLGANITQGLMVNNLKTLGLGGLALAGAFAASPATPQSASAFAVDSTPSGLVVHNTSPKPLRFRLKITGDNFFIQAPCDLDIEVLSGARYFSPVAKKDPARPLHYAVEPVSVGPSSGPPPYDESVRRLCASGSPAAAPAKPAGQVVKCRSKQGSLSFSDKGCPPGHEQADTRKIEPSASLLPMQTALVQEVKVTTLVLKASGGMYRAGGKVNGSPANFLIDTGASAVSVPERFAFEAGIRCQQRGRSSTANGSTEMCVGEADIDLGPFHMKNVRVNVLPNLNEPLIGMSVLSMFRIEQDRGTMRISLKE
jgi:aspartyl protease family protein